MCGGGGGAAMAGSAGSAGGSARKRLMKEEDMTKVEFETSEEVDVTPTFDTMGLREDLLRGIYAYGGRRGPKRKGRGARGRGTSRGHGGARGPRQDPDVAPPRLRRAAGVGPALMVSLGPRRVREAVGHPAASHQADHQGQGRDRPVSAAGGGTGGVGRTPCLEAGEWDRPPLGLAGCGE